MQMIKLQEQRGPPPSISMPSDRSHGQQRLFKANSFTGVGSYPTLSPGYSPYSTGRVASGYPNQLHSGHLQQHPQQQHPQQQHPQLQQQHQQQQQQQVYGPFSPSNAMHRPPMSGYDEQREMRRYTYSDEHMLSHSPYPPPPRAVPDRPVRPPASADFPWPTVQHDEYGDGTPRGSFYRPARLLSDLTDDLASGMRSASFDMSQLGASLFPLPPPSSSSSQSNRSLYGQSDLTYSPSHASSLSTIDDLRNLHL